MSSPSRKRALSGPDVTTGADCDVASAPLVNVSRTSDLYASSLVVTLNSLAHQCDGAMLARLHANTSAAESHVSADLSSVFVAIQMSVAEYATGARHHQQGVYKLLDAKEDELRDCVKTLQAYLQQLSVAVDHTPEFLLESSLVIQGLIENTDTLSPISLLLTADSDAPLLPMSTSSRVAVAVGLARSNVIPPRYLARGGLNLVTIFVFDTDGEQVRSLHSEDVTITFTKDSIGWDVVSVSVTENALLIGVITTSDCTLTVVMDVCLDGSSKGVELKVVASAEVEAAAVALLARIPAALLTYGIWEVALSVDDFRSLITAFSTAFTSRLVAETFIEAMYCICGDEMMEDNHVSAGAAGVVHAIVKALCEHGRCSEVLASRACRTLANFADSSGIGTNQIVLAEGGAGLSAIYSMMTYYAEGDNICYEVQYEACRALFKLLYGAYAADSGAIQVMQDGRAAMRLEAVFRLFPAEAELGNHVHNWGAIAYENLTDVAFPYVAR